MMNLSLTSLTKPLGAFLRRFHVILFVITVLGGLAVCVYYLNTIIQTSTDTAGYESTATSSSFDQVTIKKLDGLKNADESPTVTPMPGRTNPFVE